MNSLTVDQFQRALPAQIKGTVNQQLVDDINKLFNDPVLMHNFRDNLLGFSGVMRDGKFKMQDYINAVKYVSYKLLGSSNIDAYVKTFPDRYQMYIANKTSDKDIASYVSSYNKNKLVNLIYEQALVPTHILNADLLQKAINTQAQIMCDPDVSPKVRSDAANSLMTHLKAPETKKIELDIGLKQDNTIDDLRRATQELREAQKTAMMLGNASAKDIAHSGILIEHDELE
jgi:hypothetical protein